MITLSYGFKKPQSNDRGPVVFPALEDNWQRVNDHDHNGVNSKKLSSTSIESISSNVSAAGWNSLGGGFYKQTVNMPAGMEYSKTSLEVRLANGNVIHPTIIKLSEGQFEIYVNDNTLDLKVVFS